jgi:hypothetical protein
MPPVNSGESGMRFYSDLEIDLLIDDLTKVAEEAIERAAAEAAKASALASLEREAMALAEAQKWNRKFLDEKAKGFRNSVIAGVIGFVAGAALSGVVVIAVGSAAK